MNGNLNRIQELANEQKKIYSEMTSLIRRACSEGNLTSIEQILNEYKLKLEAIKNEIDRQNI